MTYPQDPQGWPPRQPGGYDPDGAGYGDPYAQPLPPDPNQYPPPGQYPNQGPYPTSGYPNAPTSGYPTSGQPTSGYPGAPTSGHPGAPTSGYPAAGHPAAAFGAPGYGTPGYGDPTYGAPTYGAPTYGAPGRGGYPPVPPPKKSRAGLVLGIVAGVVVLAVIAGTIGAWALFSDSGPEPEPTVAAPVTQSPSPSVSPTDPAQLAQFKDPDLRQFARRAAGASDRCEVITTSIPAANNAAEALKCLYDTGQQVYFLRYKTLADRDSYAQSARTGFSDDSLVVDGDTFWTDDKQVRQGSFITGRNTSDNGRYIFWDVPGKPVSGEVYSTSSDASAAEQFWRKVR